MKFAKFLIFTFLLWSVAWAAGPSKPQTTPLGYNVQVVVAQTAYTEYPDPYTTGQIARPPIRMVVTVTDLLGGPPTTDYQIGVYWVDNPTTVVSDDAMRILWGTTDRSLFCHIPEASVTQTAGTPFTAIQIYPTRAENSGFGYCLIPEGEYRLEVFVHDGNKFGYAGGLLTVPLMQRGTGFNLVF